MKKLIAVLLSAAMVLTAAACGSQPAETTAAATTAAATTAAATTAAATTEAAATEAATTEAAATEAAAEGPSGTLNVVLGADIAPESIPMWVEEFNQLYPNVTLNVSLLDLTNYAVTYEPYVTSGEMPDVMSVSAIPYYENLAEEGLLLDVSETKAFAKELDVCKNAFTSASGVNYGLAASVSTEVLFYNKEYFANAGIEKLPENWEEFIDCCEKLKAAGYAPLAIAGAGANNLGHSFMGFGVANEIYASGYDKDWVKNNKNGAYDYDTPEWKKVLEKTAYLRDNEFFQDGFESADLYEAIRVFSSGEAAMTIQQSTQAGNCFASGNENLSCMSVPWHSKDAEKVALVFAGDGYGLGKNSNNEQNKELALLFLDFISYEKAYYFQNESKSLSPFKDEADMPNYNAAESCKEALANNLTMQMTTLPAVGFNATTYAAVKEFVQAVTLGMAEPDQIAEYLNPAQEEYAATLK